jgi:hypothetical protein
MRLLFTTFGRAVLSQLHFRMLLLTVLPFVLSLAIWGLALWFGLGPFGLGPSVDWIGRYFSDLATSNTAASMLDWVGADAIQAALLSLLAMWLLLPLMIMTALIFVGVFAMPAISVHVAASDFPELEKRRGGSLLGSVLGGLFAFLMFLVLWLLTLPLMAVPPLNLLVQPLLWGWLTYRVMAYDALASHASAEERRHIMRRHRWPLLAIGVIMGAAGAAPTLLWLGGALAVIFLPVLASASIWLYVLIFVFTGLWFQHYCLEALAMERGSQVRARSVAIEPPRTNST